MMPYKPSSRRMPSPFAAALNLTVQRPQKVVREAPSYFEYQTTKGKKDVEERKRGS